MNRRYDAEDYERELDRCIAARTEAIENDIRAGRTCTTDRVLDLIYEMSRGAFSARRMLWTAMTMGAWAVGPRVVAAVNGAIYIYAEHLAETDVADMERNRAASADEYRIDMVEFERGLA